MGSLKWTGVGDRAIELSSIASRERSQERRCFAWMCRTLALVVVLMAPASALADEIWRMGSELNFTESVVIRSSLTIEPGVTATFSNNAQLVIASGATLLVEGTGAMPVRLGPASQSDSWNGLHFLPDSVGTVRFLEISGSSSTGVRITNASPLLEDCRFGNSVDDGSLGLVFFTGVLVTGDSAHPIIRRCIIESMQGHSRTAANNAVDGVVGATGASGTIFSPDGKPGGVGTAGGNGANGPAGGGAFGIVVIGSAAVTIESSIIRGIVAGDGGRGGDGGDGGNGGGGGSGISSAFASGGGAGGDGEIAAIDHSITVDVGLAGSAPLTQQSAEIAVVHGAVLVKVGRTRLRLDTEHARRGRADPDLVRRESVIVALIALE